MSTMNIFTKDKTIEGTCKDVGLSEKFGPVVCATTFKSTEEEIAIAKIYFMGWEREFGQGMLIDCARLSAPYTQNMSVQIFIMP